MAQLLSGEDLKYLYGIYSAVDKDQFQKILQKIREISSHPIKLSEARLEELKVRKELEIVTREYWGIKKRDYSFRNKEELGKAENLNGEIKKSKIKRGRAIQLNLVENSED